MSGHDSRTPAAGAVGPLLGCQADSPARRADRGQDTQASTFERYQTVTRQPFLAQSQMAAKSTIAER